MIIIRPYDAADFEQVKALHQKQGIAYELPDLEASGMLVRAVVEDDGRISQACFLRKTAEAYLLVDGADSRRNKLGYFMALQAEMIAPALRSGLTDVHCWLPPAMEKDFGRLLRNPKLGWAKALWPCYTRELIVRNS